MVLSCNTKEEAEILAQRGFSKASIRQVPEEHSGKALFGKSVPLIRPLLAEIEEQHSFDYLLLTNSDIYPAIRSGTIPRYWATTAPALALTREETHELASHSFDTEAPYRGGLDTFFFTRPALAKLNRALKQIPAAAQMAFGIPGWDYLMCALVLSPSIAGAVLDSRVLLHRSHQTSYGNMNQFECYVPDLRRLETVTAADTSAAAAEFAELIANNCRKNSKRSRLAKLLFYDPRRRSSEPGNPGSEFEQCWKRLMGLAPGFGYCYRKTAIVSLFSRLRSDQTASLESGLSLLVNSNSVHFKFDQMLFAILFALVARNEPPHGGYASIYPEGNQHAAALRNILDRHDESDPFRRVWIARLFGSELVDHGIFNPRLYEFLVLACENDCEMRLIQEILAITRGTKRHAA